MKNEVDQIVADIRSKRRFLVTSHARPDGDSIGSEMALALALEGTGRETAVVNADPVPAAYRSFPEIDRVLVASSVHETFDSAIILECGTLARPGVGGLEPQFLINIDHHPGNTLYGALNWFDTRAAACGEMVYLLIRALEAPLTADIATYLYLAILTDTGSFRFSSVTADTFGICRDLVNAGANPAAVAEAVYDNNSFAKLKLSSAVMGTLARDETGRIAWLHLTRAMLDASQAADDETEGLINYPLTARDVKAVAFFKQAENGAYRVSLRSKGAIDVGRIAGAFGGGGHRNAAGFTIEGPFETIRQTTLERLRQALDENSVK